MSGAETQGFRAIRPAVAERPGGSCPEPKQGEARCVGQSILLVIERKKGVGSYLDGDGNVEQIHRPSRHLKRVFCSKIAGGSNRIRPGKLHEWPVAEPHLLFKQPHELAPLPTAHETNPPRLVKP